MTRWSRYFLPTLREDPKDAEAISHTLMVRAGLIRRLGSGAYSYLPFGFRALQKVLRIIREEMERAGAHECLLPALQPIELWKTTGRDALLGDILITFQDRTEKTVVLGPTHEEVITSLMAEVKSHRQLPVTLYQIQTKFRDEPRPRFGVIRSKEFLMKDAYSFDVDTDGLGKSYQRMFDAYTRIFARCGLSVLACEASSGVMGGDVSHEFMAPSPNGEDVVVRCSGCGYAANRETAHGQSTVPARPEDHGAGGHSPQSTEEHPQPLALVKTPGQHTVEQVSSFLKVTPAQLIKTLIYEAGQETVAVVVRGDHEANDVKVARVVGTPRMRLASAAIIQRVTGAPMGFTGPVKLAGVRLIVDTDVMSMPEAVAGANQADAHLLHVVPGRDFTPSQVADVRQVVAGDLCARCGQPLELVRAIEVGHVFKLGTKYSQALGAIVQDASGKSVPMVMGCYGIGVNRILASAIEQRHDAQGILWPAAISPFHVVVSVLAAPDSAAFRAGQDLSELLTRAGLDVLWDDRDQSPGSKLKDADLIGIPLQVIVGKVWEQEQRVEVVERASKTKHRVEPSLLVETLNKLLDKSPSSE